MPLTAWNIEKIPAYRMTWPAVSKPKNGTWDHISGLCQAGLCHTMFLNCMHTKDN